MLIKLLQNGERQQQWRTLCCHLQSFPNFTLVEVFQCLSLPYCEQIKISKFSLEVFCRIVLKKSQNSQHNILIKYLDNIIRALIKGSVLVNMNVLCSIISLWRWYESCQPGIQSKVLLPVSLFFIISCSVKALRSFYYILLTADLKCITKKKKTEIWLSDLLCCAAPQNGTLRILTKITDCKNKDVLAWILTVEL